MLNYFYKSPINEFLAESVETIFGKISLSNTFEAKLTQQKAWQEQIEILKEVLRDYEGMLFFEFSIPRMGKRVDVLAIIRDVIFVIEFKVGEKQYHQHQVEQVWDYALDLKNFHLPSHAAILAPVLLATNAPYENYAVSFTSHNDRLLLPIKTNSATLKEVIENVLLFASLGNEVDGDTYAMGKYAPTPTIIEAAISLYNNHSVDAITRSDAEATNLSQTANEIFKIIKDSKANQQKSLCLVTGVPGAGKTLVGLKIATARQEEMHETQSVYLSGNGPLVAILQEALTRDKVKREAELGNKISKGKARMAVKTFIQNVHHYRDSYLIDKTAPYDHIAIFDEAQRAWNKEQTVKFMRQKKNQPHFDASEPEFLISCLDRHKDWAVIVCLVGEGQEINTGEAGISEWLSAIDNKFQQWQVFASPKLLERELATSQALSVLQQKQSLQYREDLHLAVSLRSFRAEHLSLFVHQLLDLNAAAAQSTYQKFAANYAIVLTRNLQKAKSWLKEKARGSERYGMVVSAQAQRLKPYAIDVKTPIDPVNWFLQGKDDIRSSYFLEDVATEFHVQGLELDWTCVVWDGDLRYTENQWQTYSFKGSKWQNINAAERKKYLINAYRVLLTRARQGMVIVVPDGSAEDATRKPEFYDATYAYLSSLGLQLI